MYPEVDIRWVRGRDPELQVARCPSPRDESGRKDSAASASASDGGGLAGGGGKGGAAGGDKGKKPERDIGPVLERVWLSPFGFADLHYLFQCQGLRPREGAEGIPLAATKAEACEKVPKVWRWWVKLGVAMLIIIPLLILIWVLFCRDDYEASVRELTLDYTSEARAGGIEREGAVALGRRKEAIEMGRRGYDRVGDIELND